MWAVCRYGSIFVSVSSRVGFFERILSPFFLSKHGFGFGSFLHHYVRKKERKKKQQRVMLVVFAAVVNPDINKQDSLKMATL